MCCSWRGRGTTRRRRERLSLGGDRLRPYVGGPLSLSRRPQSGLLHHTERPQAAAARPSAGSPSAVSAAPASRSSRWRSLMLLARALPPMQLRRPLRCRHCCLLLHSGHSASRAAQTDAASPPPRSIDARACTRAAVESDRGSLRALESSVTARREGRRPGIPSTAAESGRAPRIRDRSLAPAIANSLPTGKGGVW